MRIRVPFRAARRWSMAWAAVTWVASLATVGELAAGQAMTRGAQYAWAVLALLSASVVVFWIGVAGGYARTLQQERDRRRDAATMLPFCRRCETATLSAGGPCGHPACAECGWCPRCGGPYALGPRP